MADQSELEIMHEEIAGELRERCDRRLRLHARGQFDATTVCEALTSSSVELAKAG